MTASIAKPFVHVEDANGNPYVGASLYIYDVGTTTKKAIYSDTGLSVSVTNPLTSDSAGNFSRVYIAAGTYKLRAETSAGVLIWEYDNIDTGLNAGSGALAITGGGTGATTAAGARTALGAAAQSDVDDLADEIADINTSLQNIVNVPQGRLTLTSATPVLSTGVAAATSVYYTPFVGNLAPIPDGTQFNTTSFSELTLTLNANHLANAIYDVFLFLNSGSITIGTGPAWNTATAGSGARGSGAGTTELTYTLGGLPTNANAMTARNGATTYSVAAKNGLYIGSLYMDGSNGQITVHTAYGQSRKLGVWNAFNQRPVELQAGDGTASWTYATATYRPSNNATANSLTTFCGLPDNPVFLKFQQSGQLDLNSAASLQEILIGIGVNSTIAITGQNGRVGARAGTSTSSGSGNMVAETTLAPGIGINTITALEKGNSSVSTATFLGTAADMRLTARWWA